MTRYDRSLFIFRRDLRIVDNTGLNAALSTSQSVLPCFIFDPKQIQKHPYQSLPALQFMLASLADLQQSLQTLNSDLWLFHDSPIAVVKRLVTEQAIKAVYVNRDYTPFSRNRDAELATLCLSLNIAFHVEADCLLSEPEQAVKSDGSPYKVFTAFYNNARQFSVSLPNTLKKNNFIKPHQEKTTTIKTITNAVFNETGLNNHVLGGRSEALSILGQINRQSHYQTTRDFPHLDTTTRLSAHLKFGTCSIREVYYAVLEALGQEHPLLRQLYWRDFFTHIGFHFPHVFGKAFMRQYDHLVWDNNLDLFQRWATGTTGFPIVDAGMRELNATGFMHNRVRMITASFLIKDLHISWRWGERYFAQHLVDYDPAINNGNWQWAASTGCDAQPYFRIFNPWLQQQKFDPDCQYIYRWLPELQGISAKIIHHWYDKHMSSHYPEPMLDHSQQSQITKQRYQTCIR